MSALPSIPQSWRRLILLVPAVIFAIAIVTSLYHGGLRPALPQVIVPAVDKNDDIHAATTTTTTTTALDNIPALVRALWAPLVVPITAPVFTALDGTEKRLPPVHELIHTTPLRSRICILDVDTRPLDEDGHVFSPTMPTWDALRSQSAGFMGHYLYALIHGYAYKLIRAPQYADRAPHWTKVVFTQELLRRRRDRYDVVVMMDSDVVFASPELPLEWLLNYWRIDRRVVVAMAEDPDLDVNMDLRGKVNLNTGFIIAQTDSASNNTERLFGEWATCPEDEKRYPGCAQWKDKFCHEQAAFSSHVRYDFLDGLSVEKGEGRKYIRMLPCNEANGAPERKHTGCTGQLVRHYWADKALTRRELHDAVMRALTPRLAKAGFWGEERDPAVVEDWRGSVLDGDRIVEKTGEVWAA
ncbi:hypothetical protein B0T17DRAFT_489075 [Bombardia bombarda]|uniref:Nucleotide-diphospho-sugar transferase domain-containing protein n=1 Tax=Bombardia bombarda TaxID=252184 RepID=A0AA40C8A1_9PEZI|nr:hypothetical protein B0T17DRAFT_489075 [Bombardia bombarda]